MREPAMHEALATGSAWPEGLIGRVRQYSVSAWTKRVITSALASEVVLVQARSMVLRSLGASIGEGVTIEPGTRIVEPERLSIGRETYINSNCILDATGGIRLGEDVSFGYGVVLTTQDHEIGPSTHRCGAIRLEPIVIGNGTWIGSHAVVLPGVTIGSGVVVGAGALVTRDLAPNGLYLGAPARLARSLD